MAKNTPRIEQTLSPSGSVDAEYFDRLYALNPDPWDFTASNYEAEKYAATLAALPRLRYTSALEIGCSIGVFTRCLATRCERLLATDVSEHALAQARDACRDRPSIRLERCDVSADFPAGPFDLILLSEVGYYFSLPDLETLRSAISAALAPAGHLLLVHYTGETNYPITADAVHETFLAWVGRTWNSMTTHRSTSYRLDLLERNAGDIF